MAVNAKTDYELELEASRPTINNPTGTSGWLAYYISCRGCDFRKPNWVYRPNVKAEDIDDGFIQELARELKLWSDHAERWRMDVHFGVTPPNDVVVKQIASMRRRADWMITESAELKRQAEFLENALTSTSHV